MNSAFDSPSIWVLADDRPGNVTQALGVAEALDLPFAIKEIRYNAWGKLHNLLRASSRRGLYRYSRKAIEQIPPPALVIGAGRRTAPLARWFKRRFDSKIVQLMDPGWPGRAAFDLIAVPRHDDTPEAANLIRTLGSCHRASPLRLSLEAAHWQDQLPDLPRPWTLVAVGGAARGGGFVAESAQRLIGDCRRFPGSLFVVTSRRTGLAAEKAIAALLPEGSYFRPWGAAGENPYLGLLALADRIVVTGDSMSMCSEACANGGPVFIQDDAELPEKFRLLHRDLYEAGYARPLSGGDLGDWRHPPLNAAGEVAAEIRRRGLL